MDDAELMREILEALLSDTSQPDSRAGACAGRVRCQGDGAPGPLFQRRLRQRRRYLHGAHPAGDREESGGGRPGGLRSIAPVAAERVSEVAGRGCEPNRLNSSARLSLRPRTARRRASIQAVAHPRRPRYRRRVSPAGQFGTSRSSIRSAPIPRRSKQCIRASGTAPRTTRSDSKRAANLKISPQAGLLTSTVIAGGSRSPTLRGFRKCSNRSSEYIRCFTHFMPMRRPRGRVAGALSSIRNDGMLS